MNKILGLIVLVLAFGIPTLAQSRMSPDDQARFNSYYSRWMHDQQTGNRGDMASMERRMQDLMSRYGIPSDTPYDAIAQGENGGYYGNRDRDRDRGRDRDRDRDYDRDGDQGYAGRWHRQARLSPDDQQRFDSAYQHWLHERQEGDRGGMERQERTMQDIMSRYNIPQNVPYDAIASGGQGY